MSSKSNSLVKILQNALKTRTSSLGFDKNLTKVLVTSAGDGKCLAELDIDDSHCNINGVLHGGMTSTLVDIVSTLALTTKNGGTNPGSTVDLSVSFMKAAKKGSTVIIKADTVKAGKSLAFLSVELIDKSTGTIVATGKQTKYIG